MKKLLRAFCNFSYWQSRCHVLILIACLSLAAVGQMPDSSAGWVLVLPTPIAVARKKKPTKGDRRRRARQKHRNHQKTEIRQALVAHHAKTTWLVPTLRTFTLAGSFLFLDPKWLILSLVPVGLWLIQLLILLYPKTNQPEVKAIKLLAQLAEQVLMLAVISVLLSQGMIYFIDFLSIPESNALLAASAVIISGAGSTVTLETKVDSDGNESYHATLSGNFELSVEATEASDVQATETSDTKRRLLILLLRQLEVPGYKRAGRHTRDSRTPFVPGAALAKAYEVQNSKISRWQKYWLESDWRRLLSERAPDVLTLELQDQIVATFAQFPWWGQQRVHKYLNQQGVKVSRRQVRLAAEESGWSTLRQQLQNRFSISAESFRPRDEWFVSQLLQTNEKLVKQLEDVNALPTQLEIEINALEELAKQNGIQAAPAIRAHAYDVTSATNTFWPMGDG